MRACRGQSFLSASRRGRCLRRWVSLLQPWLRAPFSGLEQQRLAEDCSSFRLYIARPLKTGGAWCLACSMKTLLIGAAALLATVGPASAITSYLLPADFWPDGQRA